MRCRHCGLSDGGHSVNCPVGSRQSPMPKQTVKVAPPPPPQDEPLRYALDLAEKWSTVMAERWCNLRDRMIAAGISVSQEVILEDAGGPICTLHAGYNCVMVLGNQSLSVVLRNLDKHPSFDVSILPEIQRLVLEAIKEREVILSDTLGSQEKRSKENKENLKKALSTIVDELGADIMQYRPTPRGD